MARTVNEFSADEKLAQELSKGWAERDMQCARMWFRAISLNNAQ
jgi:hypothetical protein